MDKELKPGAILRRGADKLTAAELLTLVNSSAEVNRVITEINARIDVYRKTEADTIAAVKKIEEVTKAVKADEVAVAKAREDLAAASAESDANHKSDMADLDRRLEELDAQAAEMDKRKAELDVREAKLEQGNKKFTDLADWMETNNPKGHH